MDRTELVADQDRNDATALRGLRVVELSSGVAAGIVGMLLADFGAEVVLVEPPEGSSDRAQPGFAVRGRNKRSVAIDQGDPADQTRLAQLIAGADVCIVDDAARSVWSLPVVARAAKANRRLVTVRMPAYLDETVPWFGGRESNRLLAARLGQSRRQSSFDGGAVDSVSPSMLYVHGVWTAACAVSAIYEMLRSGFGQTVTVTGANAVMEATVMSLSVDPEAPDAPSNVGPRGRHPTYGPLCCANGEWMSSGALGPKFERIVFDVLGLSEMLDDPRMGGSTARMGLPENFDRCVQAIAENAASWNRDDLIAALLARGVPAGRIEDQNAWLDHEQVRAIGMRAEVKRSDGSTVVMPGIPIVLTRTPGKVSAAAPELGEHQDTNHWSPRPAPTGLAPLARGPLAGVTVLNLGTFVATPYAGFLLAELGARVIKVEPLTGDPFRATAYAVNRGMESLAIDLKADSGQRLLHRLVESSDIVLDGMRPGVMADLQLDYATLAEINPRIITVSLSAYGEGGPLSGLPGVDMVIQAVSGMMSAQGGDDQPVANTIAINDVTTAAMSALASTLALVEREHSGRGQHVWDSLAATAGYLQMDAIVRSDGHTEPVKGGRDFAGPGPLNRYYEAADGWLAIDVQDPLSDTAERLQAAGLPGPDELVPAIARERVADLVQRLNAAAIPATAARLVSDVIRDPELMESEFSHIRASEDGGVFVVPGRLAAFSRTPRFGPMYPAGVGENTRASLQLAGLGDAEIDSAIDSGVVVSGGPMAARLFPPYR